MFEYKFVKVELHWGFTRSKPAEDYQEIIQEHARDGWRFVQIVALRLAVLDNLNISISYSKRKYHYNTKKEQAEKLTLLLMTTVFPTNWNWFR